MFSFVASAKYISLLSLVMLHMFFTNYFNMLLVFYHYYLIQNIEDTYFIIILDYWVIYF